MEKHQNPMMAPSSPTPTTFVQADTTTFRELVQKLTGATGDPADKLPVTFPTRLSSRPYNPIDATGIRRSPFKLQERRHTMRKLEIKLGLTSLRNSSSPTIQSPVTPLGCDAVFSAVAGGGGVDSPSSPELFSVLQQVRKTMALFQSHEQKKEATHLVELDEMFQTFDELIQRASELVFGTTQIERSVDLGDPVGEIGREGVIEKRVFGESV